MLVRCGQMPEDTLPGEGSHSSSSCLNSTLSGYSNSKTHILTQVFLLVRVGAVYIKTLVYKFLELDSLATRTCVSMSLQVQPGISHQKIFTTILVKGGQWLWHTQKAYLC